MENDEKKVLEMSKMDFFEFKIGLKNEGKVAFKSSYTLPEFAAQEWMATRPDLTLASYFVEVEDCDKVLHSLELRQDFEGDFLAYRVEGSWSDL